MTPFQKIEHTIEFSFALKRRMQASKLLIACTPCTAPGCRGMVNAALLGKREHLHLACDQPQCFVRLIE